MRRHKGLMGEQLLVPALCMEARGLCALLPYLGGREFSSLIPKHCSFPHKTKIIFLHSTFSNCSISRGLSELG